jgi:SAM-dependent methyltransferase
VLMSSYDAIAALYDPWSRSVTEDVDFYVAQARKSGGPVVELGVGTGRIAVPVAKTGVCVIGIDDSEGMLALCRSRAEEAGVSDLVELRLGDLRRPPVLERVPLVTCPFRALLHLGSDGERLEALRAVYRLLIPHGRFVFDVFAPSMEDVEGSGSAPTGTCSGASSRSPSGAKTARRPCSSAGARPRSGARCSSAPASKLRPCTAGSTSEPTTAARTRSGLPAVLRFRVGKWSG